MQKFKIGETVIVNDKLYVIHDIKRDDKEDIYEVYPPDVQRRIDTNPSIVQEESFHRRYCQWFTEREVLEQTRPDELRVPTHMGVIVIKTAALTSSHPMIIADLELPNGSIRELGRICGSNKKDLLNIDVLDGTQGRTVHTATYTPKSLTRQSGNTPHTEWNKDAAPYVTTEEQWKTQERQIIISGVRLPFLSDLEADCDAYGKPMCDAEQIPAAFVCCDSTYYLINGIIQKVTAQYGYLPNSLELRLVVTIANAKEYSLHKGSVFTMEGVDFRMISDTEAIMQHGLKNLERWNDTSYLWGRVITDFILHKYSNPEVGATFIFRPKSLEEDC